MKTKYNIFICYRGVGTGDRECIDGKYIALDVYHELAGNSLFNCFFAPKKYMPGNDFKNEIPDILNDVKVALLILTNGFFDYCHDENDIVNIELTEILNRNIKIIPIVVDDYNIEKDRDKIIKLYGIENVNRFITTTNVNYTGVYNFATQAVRLSESIKKYLDAADNNISFDQVDKKSVLTFLNNIANSSSVTYASEKLIDAIISVLQMGIQSLEEIRNDVEELIEKICVKVPHFSTLKTNVLHDLLKLLSGEDKEIVRDELEDYKKRKNDIQSDIQKKRNLVVSKGDNILTFSESKHVINILNYLSEPIRETCTVYICEARAKVSIPFADAKRIYDSLLGFKEKYLITDNCIYTLMNEGKINKVIIGACAVEVLNDELISFVNTAGTEILLRFAKEFNIPVYIISELDKHLENFKSRENRVSTLELQNLGYQSDDVNYIYFERPENVVFVSENGIDIKYIIDHYYNDIWKDKRKLAPKDDIFIKCCDKEEYVFEKNILEKLHAVEGINIAPIIKAEDEKNRIHMERIKGIRIFELLVGLDYLAYNSVEKAIDVKNVIIKRCNKQQILLNGKIEELLLNNNDIKIYPESKIIDFIEFLYKTVLIFYPSEFKCINLNDLKEDAIELYNRFYNFAKLNPKPFRDSTTKNMVLCDEKLNGLDCDLFTNDGFEQFICKLYDIITSKNFDEFKKSKIYDFDFSSCINYTTQYDDYIGLNLHERTFSLQTEKRILRMYKNNEEFLISLIIRYLRFGGRKLAYKLLNPNIHKIRFKFDNYQFYFAKIKLYIDKLYPVYSKEFEDFYKFITIISKLPIKNVNFDLFQHIKSQEKRIGWMGMCNGNVDALDL